MRLLFLTSSLALLLLPVVVFADGIPLDRLTVSGQVRGQGGAGAAGVRVYVNGEDYETVTDAAGNYVLFIPLSEFGNFKSKTKIRIKAKGAKKAYHTTTRQEVLAIDIKRESRSGKEHCEIRGNEARLVREIGEAINAGEPELHVRAMHFLYPEKLGRRLTMKAKSVVIMGKQKESLVGSAPPPVLKSAAPSNATAGITAGAAVGATTLPAPVSPPKPPPAAVDPNDGGCECRISGTIEVHSDRRISDDLKVFVSLAEAIAVRDTVELFMGSPRAFELSAPRCADWTLNVEAVGKHKFTVVSVDGSEPVRCGQGGLQQLRIVLAPR